MNILFDFDGTLVNPHLRLYTIHKDLTQKYSLKALSQTEYIESKRNIKPELFNIMGTAFSQAKEKYKTERPYLIEDSSYLALDTLYEGVREVLNILKKNHRLFLTTIRKDRQRLLNQVETLDLADFFVKIYSVKTDDLTTDLIKAKENLIQQCLKEYKSKTSIIVGDTEADIEAGRRQGIITVAIDTGMRSRKNLTSFYPDYFISNLRELLNIIKRIGK